jgi:TonB-dependent SusC/RagA subfamily outer membrane receptor
MKIKVLISISLSLILSVNILTAQKNSKKIIVSGYVTDTVRNPVVGAVIFINNKDTQIRTDNSGHYKIRIRPDAVVISVMSQNNQFKSELIGGQTAINFSLGENDILPQTRQDEGKAEELIDLGYRRIDTKTTAIPVSKSDFLDVSENENTMYHNIYEMIQGKVPGVDVSGQKVRIRGVNSLVGDNDPMFVVDGMPVNSIDNIMPNTVQSITVLKGSSAAIYGSRGVNGVIVISLKKNNPKTK